MFFKLHIIKEAQSLGLVSMSIHSSLSHDYIVAWSEFRPLSLTRTIESDIFCWVLL